MDEKKIARLSDNLAKQQPITGGLYKVRNVVLKAIDANCYNGVTFDHRIVSNPGVSSVGHPTWVNDRGQIAAGEIILLVSVDYMQPMWSYSEGIPDTASDMYYVISFLHEEKLYEGVHICTEDNAWSAYFELVGSNRDLDKEEKEENTNAGK